MSTLTKKIEEKLTEIEAIETDDYIEGYRDGIGEVLVILEDISQDDFDSDFELSDTLH